jgi:hypothetical protein
MNYVDRYDRGEALVGAKPGFTKDQLRKLVREVDANHTHTRSGQCTGASSCWSVVGGARYGFVGPSHAAVQAYARDENR